MEGKEREKKRRERERESVKRKEEKEKSADGGRSHPSDQNHSLNCFLTN